MQVKKSISDIEKDYDLEIDRIISNIKNLKKKNPKVLLQFPDGLKPYATVVVQELEEKCSAEFFIWLGSCYGACDTPNVSNKGFDLLVQFGHSFWKS